MVAPFQHRSIARLTAQLWLAAHTFGRGFAHLAGEGRGSPDKVAACLPRDGPTRMIVGGRSDLEQFLFRNHSLNDATAAAVLPRSERDGHTPVLRRRPS
jgi:hypothetical protein